jgi:tetratricopeptide (TPR) repeat protein
MGQGNSGSRISDGIPWWIWLTTVAVTVLVLFGIFVGQHDEESLDALFGRTCTALEERRKDTFEECFDEYRHRDGDSDRTAVLEAIAAGVSNRYPKSIMLLKPFLEHADPVVQKLAIKHTGLAHQVIGDKNAARLMYRKCIEMAPADVPTRILLLNLYTAGGVVEDAAELAKEILESDPKNQTAATAMTEALLSTGRLSEAISLLETQLQTEGERASASPDMIASYLNCLIETDQTDVATQFYDENESIVRDNQIRMTLYLKNGRLDDADALLQQSEKEPDWILVTRLKAARAMQSENWDLAVRTLSDAVLVMPRSPQLFQDLEQAATKGNKPGLVESCQANLRGIRELQQNLQVTIKAIGNDMQNPQLRLDVAQAAEQLGLESEFYKWHRAALNVASDERDKLRRTQPIFTNPSKPLIPLPTAFVESSESDEATDQTPAE